MKGLKGKDGVVATDREEMVGIVEAFYTHLFGKKEVVEERLEEVLGFIENVVEDGAELEAELSMVDVNNSLRSFKSGKAPGVDGLSAEFYKAFWEVVGPVLLCIFKEFDDLKKLPESFWNGVVTLLFKKGARTDLGNRRPITLFNFDLKLYLKILTIKMNCVLGGIGSQTEPEKDSAETVWPVGGDREARTPFERRGGQNEGSRGGI